MTQYTIGNVTFAPAPRISVRQLVDDTNTASGKSLRDVEIAPDQREIVRRAIDGIYGLGVGTYAGGYQEQSIERAVDKILAALSKGVA